MVRPVCLACEPLPISVVGGLGQAQIAVADRVE